MAPAPRTPVIAQNSIYRSSAVGPKDELELRAVLTHADRLFYAEGVLETSMRDIARAAGVSVGRLRRIYPSKELLVLEYLRARHLADVATLAALERAELTPQQTLHRALDAIVEDLLSPGFRGCAFLNASAEAGRHYPSIVDQVHAHRDWYSEQTTRLLREAGHARSADAADDLLLARDGGMASVNGGNVVSAVGAMKRAIRRALSGL